MPCRMLLRMSVFMPTLRSKLIIHSPVLACSKAPNARLMRGSRRAIGIARRKPIPDPMPR
jgi:hypothetical protein